MRIRDPRMAPPEVRRPTERPWRRYRVRLVTPLYGGGVRAGAPDREMPVRAAAIRGQLRFWWRVLHPNAGFAEEAALWGAMAEPGADRASRVWLRVRDLDWNPEKAIQPCAKYQPNPKQPGKLQYRSDVSEYALFPGRGELSADRREVRIPPADIVLPRVSFTLEVRCDDDAQWKRVEAVLRWWASFGGLGARTRRGLGSIQVEELAPVTPQEVAEQGGRLVLRMPATDDAVDAWKRAVERMQAFRQGVGVGRNPGADPKRPGRSRWPEADSIREITHRHHANHAPEHPAGIAFPRAAFGMPIIFHFKDHRNGDPADTTLQPDGFERMASPLILRAYWNGRHFQPACLLIPGARDWLEGLSLKLDGSQVPAHRQRLGPDDWWPEDRARACDEAKKVPPMRDRGCDALEAFLNFF